MERFITNQLIVDSGKICSNASVISFLLFKGKDAAGRPILAVYCCHLPDPETTNYDELLE